MYAENLISTPEAQADFYPTPKELGKKMVQGIDLGFISTVLEPSAGKGDLIRCLAEKVILIMVAVQLFGLFLRALLIRAWLTIANP